jgi:DNA-binding NarL/FixJ family response regulator
MSLTTIVLADDHHVVREGLRTLLEAQADFRVVAEAADGLEAARLVEQLKPTVLVVDLSMPGLMGLEVTRQVKRLSPGTRVVILSMHSNEAYVLEALRAGALAYVLKVSTADDLVQAVQEAAAGRRYLSPPLSDRAIAAYVQKAEAAPFDPYQTLTNREREVLQLAAEGYTNPAIAEKLFISPRTAETHRANLMRKLDLRGQTDLIRYALRRGILPLEQ